MHASRPRTLPARARFPPEHASRPRTLPARARFPPAHASRPRTLPARARFKAGSCLHAMPFVPGYLQYVCFITVRARKREVLVCGSADGCKTASSKKSENTVFGLFGSKMTRKLVPFGVLSGSEHVKVCTSASGNSTLVMLVVKLVEL
jgi:hypothetical protein